MRLLLSLAILVALAMPVLADEDCGGGCPLAGGDAVAASGLDGFECQNHCPLAKQANQRRALGVEALAVSDVMRAEIAKAISRNVAKI